ncbi:MAG: DUF354 domain-containing protein [Rhodovibrionaceae bacterium]
MRVLFDIVHPAHALFFKRAVETLQARGDEVLILSRHKDITCQVLDDLGFAHRPVSRAGKGVLGLAGELLGRDWAVIRAARRFKPDVMIGFGGLAISHAGRLLGIPSVSFYDTEEATLQNRLTWPFITQLYVPQCYDGPTPKGRTTRLAGVKPLSHLHPDYFTPDREIALASGLDPERDNFLLRAVSWEANHDIGLTGWSEGHLRALVEHLSARGRVHVSSEAPLPADLAATRYAGKPTDILHLMGHCRLYVGESATMSTEAAILGIPNIFNSDVHRSYVVELSRAGLTRCVADYRSPAAALAAIDELLGEPAAEMQARRDAYVADCPDWGEEIVMAIERHAKAKVAELASRGAPGAKAQ